jgi:hypothetical protein
MDLELPLDFKDFLKLLNKNGVRYLLIGGYAVGHPPMRLEISTGIPGVEFEECYANRIVDELDGVKINVIDLPHLKANKKAAGRLKRPG